MPSSWTGSLKSSSPVFSRSASALPSAQQPYLSIILRDRAVLVPGDDVLAQKTPARNGCLALVASDGQAPLVCLLRFDVHDDVEHNDGSQIAHALLGYRQQLQAILGELDALHRGRKVPDFQTLASPHVPQADGVVGGAACKERGGGVDVDGPERALVAMVRTKALTVRREPGADDLILGSGEEDIAVAGVSTDVRSAILGGATRFSQLAYLICVRARS